MAGRMVDQLMALWFTRRDRQLPRAIQSSSYSWINLTCTHWRQAGEGALGLQPPRGGWGFKGSPAGVLYHS
jgi:hypothetical protein